MARKLSRTLTGLILLCLWTACSAESMQQGQFACVDDSDCPPGWECGSDGYCYSDGDTDTDTRNLPILDQPFIF